MLNWKKNGYELGQEVCVVYKVGFYNPKEVFIVGKITYVGTKRLKVVIPFGDNKEKTLDFNGKRSVNGVLFGDYYMVYKTKEEYDEVVAHNEKAKELREYISNNVAKLTLSELEEIKSLMDSQLA